MESGASDSNGAALDSGAAVRAEPGGSAGERCGRTVEGERSRSDSDRPRLDPTVRVEALGAGDSGRNVCVVERKMRSFVDLCGYGIFATKSNSGVQLERRFGRPSKLRTARKRLKMTVEQLASRFIAD